eukprot:635888-Rhodomonas_salina.1
MRAVCALEDGQSTVCDAGTGVCDASSDEGECASQVQRLFARRQGQPPGPPLPLFSLFSSAVRGSELGSRVKS